MFVELCNLTGEVITQDNFDYEILRQEWNRAVQKYPIAIVYCSNYEEISNAIIWSRRNKIQIRIRSGGHNYLGYSTGNCVLVIDISKINKIYLDETNKKVKIGSGAKNSQLYEVLTSKGYPFPGGTCPTVGVSGYALGGGWGLSARKFGLGCDSLLEVELINYEGKLIKANNCCNRDLFWALKGSGGGNYGVVVSLTFAIPNEKVDLVSLFSIYYPKATIEVQHDFFDKWQVWTKNGSWDINMRGGIYNDSEDGRYIYVMGLSYLNQVETEIDLESFLSIPGAKLDIQYIPLKEAIEKVESTYLPYEYFKSAGRFASSFIGYNEIDNLLELINNDRPEGSYLTSLNVYGFGGEISQVDKNDTAFYYRNAQYILYFQTVFEDIKYVQTNNDWVKDNYFKLENITCGSYVNFPYEYLKCPIYEYYGENSCCIRQIKKKYDPYNVFNFPQGIK